MNVARVAINRRLMCGQNCNSVKSLFISDLRFIYMTYFGNLLFFWRVEPTTFGLPIHCYNHYTNRGVYSQVLRDQLDSANFHMVIVITQREKKLLNHIGIGLYRY
jgi:hypothetical protein